MADFRYCPSPPWEKITDFIPTFLSLHDIFNLIPTPNVSSNQKGSSFNRRFERIKRYWFTFISHSDLFHFLGYLSLPPREKFGERHKNITEDRVSTLIHINCDKIGIFFEKVISPKSAIRLNFSKFSSYLRRVWWSLTELDGVRRQCLRRHRISQLYRYSGFKKCTETLSPSLPSL